MTRNGKFWEEDYDKVVFPMVHDASGGRDQDALLLREDRALLIAERGPALWIRVEFDRQLLVNAIENAIDHGIASIIYGDAYFDARRSRSMMQRPYRVYRKDELIILEVVPTGTYETSVSRRLMELKYNDAVQVVRDCRMSSL